MARNKACGRLCRHEWQNFVSGYRHANSLKAGVLHRNSQFFYELDGVSAWQVYIEHVFVECL